MTTLLTLALLTTGCSKEDPGGVGTSGAQDSAAPALGDTDTTGGSTDGGSSGGTTDGGSGGTTDGGATGSDDTAPNADTDAPADTDDTAAAAPPLVEFSDGEPPTNVLMISIDTLRRDYVGRYAGGKSLTPRLDRLLEEGVALDQHRSCSNWTYPSILCALMGQYNVDQGWFPHATGPGDEEARPIPPDSPLFSAALRDRGFRSALVGANPYLGEASGLPDYYDSADVSADYAADEVIDRGLGALEIIKRTGAPWLLHLHFYDPHSPYDPPEALVDGATTVMGYDLRTFDGAVEANQAYHTMPPKQQEVLEDYAVRMYSGEVAYLDQQIGELLDSLDAAGDLEDTLVVLWSDHGEQLWQRGELEHGHDLHSEESGGIAGFWARDIVPKTTALPTTHADLAPTALVALGGLIPPSYTGRVLTEHTEPAPTFSAVVTSLNILQSVDYGGKRLIYSWDGTLRYYDLSTDPNEIINLYSPTNEDMLELWGILWPEVGRMADLYSGDYIPIPPRLDE